MIHTCARCKATAEGVNNSVFGERMPNGWSVLQMRGTPTITRKLCDSCVATVIYTLDYQTLG